MTGWDALDRFLDTDPEDVGCEKAMALLHTYVELLRADPETATGRYAGVEAHLRACGPCGEDFEGLLFAVSAEQRPKVL
jgi:hypothetical protein